MKDASHDMVVPVLQAGPLTILGIALKVLDSSKAGALRDDLRRLLKPSTTTALDLSSVQFVDSAGLAAILSGVRRAADLEGARCRSVPHAHGSTPVRARSFSQGGGHPQ